jgi:membrane associated rhomboid family serine protease
MRTGDSSGRFRPLGSRSYRTGSGSREAVTILLLLNGIGFIAQMMWDPAVTWNFGLTPAAAWSGLRLWQFGTYMFLHGGWMHLIFNLYALWVFGAELESDWGFGAFLRYYLICGVGAGLFHALITPHSMVPTIGASGAVSGVMAAYAMSYPERELQLLLFFVLPVRMKAKVLALGLAGVSLLLGVLGSPDGVAHFAHLGGMLVGALVLMIDRRGRSPAAAFRDWRRKRKFRLAVRRRRESEAVIESANEILDRIHREGSGSVSESDRKKLRKAGRDLDRLNGRKDE